MTEKLPILHEALISQIDALGLPCDFTLELRGYSKSFNGLYYPSDQKIVLYVRRNDGKMRNFRRLMSTLIHEVVHHYQFAYDPEYERVKGVMHDPEFKQMFEYYHEKYMENKEKQDDR